MDAELAVVVAREKREAAELKERLRREREAEEARRKPVHAPADPRKIQAQIEVCCEQAVAAVGVGVVMVPSYWWWRCWLAA